MSGARLHTRVAGTGPSVLWLHGYTMDSTLWAELWRRLPGFRHVGVDLPGHGGSPALSPDAALPSLAAQVAPLLREYDAQRLVGLSFGSMIALQLAIDLPDEVTRLSVAAPTVGGAPPEPGMRELYRELAFLHRCAGPEAAVARWMTSPPDIFRGTEAHPPLRARIRDVVTRHRWEELTSGAMRAVGAHRQDDAALARISARTQVLIGSADMPTFHANARRLRERLTDCRVHLIPGAGHLCLLERAESAAPLLAEHLS